MKVDTSNTQVNNDTENVVKVKKAILDGLISDIMFDKLLQKAVDKINNSSSGTAIPPANTTAAEQKTASTIGDKVALESSSQPCCKCGRLTQFIHKGKDGRNYCYACASREDD